MEHTAEKWSFAYDEQNVAQVSCGDENIADVWAGIEAAERIALCVNACAGLDQFALDGGWTAIGMSAYAKKIEQQRDELLAALESLERTSGQGCMSDDPCRIKARKAIANAKGA